MRRVLGDDHVSCPGARTGRAIEPASLVGTLGGATPARRGTQGPKRRVMASAYPLIGSPAEEDAFSVKLENVRRILSYRSLTKVRQFVPEKGEDMPWYFIIDSGAKLCNHIYLV